AILYKLDWAKKSLYNIASAGIFASDRSIKEYADRIWGLKRIK
ncbi:MAG: glycogen/starch/alpha-glucan phosphorylase, partial [Clostridiales bacterium]|nr:glycogen/starch/alpha-glucan phosphorylase [Clostridiales bacterium]